MTNLSSDIKKRIEKHLRENENAIDIAWGEDSCTALDAKGNPIEDYMINIEDQEVTYTPVSNPSVNIIIE